MKHHFREGDRSPQNVSCLKLDLGRAQESGLKLVSHFSLLIILSQYLGLCACLIWLSSLSLFGNERRGFDDRMDARFTASYQSRHILLPFSVSISHNKAGYLIKLDLFYRCKLYRSRTSESWNDQIMKFKDGASLEN